MPPAWQVWSALACVYVVWGSTYLAIRVMVEDVPPLLGAGLRFGLAGLVLAGVLVALGLATTIEMLAAGAALTLLGFAAGEAGELRIGALSTDSLAAFAYLVVMGSIVAYTAFVWLLDNATVSLVATYAYVTPLVAVALGWAILDETITLPIALGALLVIGSVT